ncbi:MAG: hypothetical protein WCO89_07425 [Syntrophus sp. (in: bacteria)]
MSDPNGGNSGGNIGAVVGKCPICGKDVQEFERMFACSAGRDVCDFTLWRDTLKIFEGAPLVTSQTRVLLEGGQIELVGLVSKAGKSFNCKGTLGSYDKKGGGKGWSVKLVFEPRVPAGATAQN